MCILCTVRDAVQHSRCVVDIFINDANVLIFIRFRTIIIIANQYVYAIPILLAIFIAQYRCLSDCLSHTISASHTAVVAAQCMALVGSHTLRMYFVGANTIFWLTSRLEKLIYVYFIFFFLFFAIDDRYRCCYRRKQSKMFESVQIVITFAHHSTHLIIVLFVLSVFPFSIYCLPPTLFAV